MATGEVNRTADDARMRSLLAAIVELSVDAIASMTLDGIATSWNSGAEAIFGYTAEEMTGRHVAALYPPDRTEELEPILAQISLVLAGASLRNPAGTQGRQRHRRVDFGLPHPRGRRRPSSGWPGFAGMSPNVTGPKPSNGRREALDCRNLPGSRAAVRVAGGMAAEFSNLLSSIMGYTASAA